FHVHHIEKAENFFKKHGNKTVFIGRFTALLRTYAAVLAGVFEMHYPTFFFYNFTGGVAWAVLMGYVGYIIGNNLPLLLRIIKDMNLAILGGLVLIIVFFIVRKIVRNRKKQLQPAVAEKHHSHVGIESHAEGVEGKQADNERKHRGLD